MPYDYSSLDAYALSYGEDYEDSQYFFGSDSDVVRNYAESYDDDLYNS